MIRSEHSIVEYDFAKMTLTPDRLRRVSDAEYVAAANRMLRIYRDGIGQRRQELHRRIEACLTQSTACPPRRVAAFCKLLDDQAEYESQRKAAVELRRQVFDLASERHPIVQRREGIFENELQQVRAEIAQSIGRPWQEIEADLFSDVIELQRIKSFQCQWTAAQLLSEYNLAQTQAALYRATRVRIDAKEDFKTIIRHAKLAGLMHRIDAVRIGGKHGYRFVFDGPQTSLRETSRYGIRFAAMIPKLLACRQWCLTAEVLGPRRQRFRLQLSHEDGLSGGLQPPDEFDSELETAVDAAWQAAPLDGWLWQRESTLLVRGQSVMTPDFSLSHQARRTRVYVEVIGYWTPEYLNEKCRRLREFAVAGSPSVSNEESIAWLLILPKKMRHDHQTQLGELGIPVIVFDKSSKPANWIEAVDSFQTGAKNPA